MSRRVRRGAVTVGGARGTTSGDRYAAVLSRLRLLGVLLPVSFVILMEIVRFETAGRGEGGVGGHVAFAAVMTLSVAAFGWAMFSVIDRAQQVLRAHNRELAVTNAVATAVRGELAVERILEAATRTALDSTGANAAVAELYGDDPASVASTRSTWLRRDGTPPEPDPDPDESAGPVGTSGPEQLLEIPLVAPTRVVGRLRLRLPAVTAAALPTTTRDSIGEQLGCAIHQAQLVTELQRRKREGHAIYEVLLRISQQHDVAELLGAAVRAAGELLGADDARLCLEAATTPFVPVDGAPAGGATPAGARACVGRDGARLLPRDAHDRSCPVHHPPGPDRNTLTVGVQGSAGARLGELRVGRDGGSAFTDRDRTFLLTLANLMAIGLANARHRDEERQHAIVSERERIARELHDSLAQVLGVTHLRLRAAYPLAAAASASADTSAAVNGSAANGSAAVDGSTANGSVPRLARELAELADLCQEAYRDVREAILGLHQSNRRGFLESLRGYLEAYQRQSGIDARLECDGDEELSVSPSCEVQLIRVIQEALTNVRKHAAATSARVRITIDATGLAVAVTDDGLGFDPRRPRRDGFGLQSMRERMALLGGELAVESAPGSGTRVVASIPMADRRAVTAAPVPTLARVVP